MRARLYRLLTRLLLPPSFSEEFGEEMADSVEGGISRSGDVWSGAWFFARELGDLVRTAAREWWSELGPGRARATRGPTRGFRTAHPAFIEQTNRDIRYALRQMRRSPGFSAAVVLTLAVGIGLNTAVFSAVHALLLRPPNGVEEPDQLLHIYRSYPGLRHGTSSIPHFRDLERGGSNSFQGIAAWSATAVSLRSGDQTEIVSGHVVSADFFDILGVDAVLGRTFLPEEARERGAHPVLVLSHGTWRSRFGGDPDVVGRTILVNERPFEVVGVAPEGFQGPTKLQSAALWLPLSMYPLSDPGSAEVHESRNANAFRIVARLKPGTDVSTVREALDGFLARLERAHPDVYEGTGIPVVPQSQFGLGPGFGDTPVKLASVIMAVVAALLLLACVNVANMFLARAEHRRREIGIRLSLGAERGRIIRQLLTESLLYAVVAGFGALAVAHMGIGGLSAAAAREVPLDARLQIDMPVLVFTLVNALGTGVLFGLAPALQMSRPASARDLRGEGRKGMGRPVLQGLVVAQTALSLILLLSAGLFLQSLWAATRVDIGISADRLVTARVSPGLAGQAATRSVEFYRTLAERLESRPEIQATTWSDVIPLGPGAGQATRVAVPGARMADPEKTAVNYAWVGPSFFETIGIALRGRGFDAADDTATGVVVVNQAMASRFWPSEEPIGQVVETQGGKRLRVVGVAADAKYETLTEQARPYMYLFFGQTSVSDAVIFVRTVGDPGLAVPIVRRTIQELDSRMPLRDVRPMESYLGAHLLPSRLAAGALALFGGLGLLLSTMGLYGVLAYVVSRDSRHIAIRFALGAGRAEVLRGVLARGLRLTLAGVAVGLVVALAGSSMLADLLYTTRVVDPAIFIGAPVLLMAVAVLATWLPARRAARLDPARVLNEE